MHDNGKFKGKNDLDQSSRSKYHVNLEWFRFYQKWKNHDKSSWGKTEDEFRSKIEQNICTFDFEFSVDCKNIGI